jgi:hypothetical protein
LRSDVVFARDGFQRKTKDSVNEETKRRLTTLCRLLWSRMADGYEKPNYPAGPSPKLFVAAVCAVTAALMVGFYYLGLR